MGRTATPKTCEFCGKENLKWSPYVNKRGNKTYQLVDWDTGKPHFGPGSTPGECTRKTRMQEVPIPKDNFDSKSETQSEEAQAEPEQSQDQVQGQDQDQNGQGQGKQDQDEQQQGEQDQDDQGEQPPPPVNADDDILRRLEKVEREKAEKTELEQSHWQLTNQVIDSEERLKKLIKSKIKSEKISIAIPDLPEIDATNEHMQFPKLCAVVALNKPAWMAGPAGSGKTTAAEHVAKKLEMEFSCISVCEQSTQFDLLGFHNAHGDYVTTEFRKRYEQGGIFLLDEVDKGSPNTLAVLQAATEAGHCAFPDGMIPKHKDFRLIASGNTYGNGADALYVGSIQLDAAFINRFAFIAWDYDEDFERKLAGNDAWVKRVQSLRKKAADLKMRVVISPRASITGAHFLKSKAFSQKEVEEMLIFGGMSESDRRALR